MSCFANLKSKLVGLHETASARQAIGNHVVTQSKPGQRYELLNEFRIKRIPNILDAERDYASGFSHRVIPHKRYVVTLQANDRINPTQKCLAKRHQGVLVGAAAASVHATQEGEHFGRAAADPALTAHEKDHFRLPVVFELGASPIHGQEVACHE